MDSELSAKVVGMVCRPEICSLNVFGCFLERFLNPNVNCDRKRKAEHRGRMECFDYKDNGF